MCSPVPLTGCGGGNCTSGPCPFAGRNCIYTPAPFRIFFDPEFSSGGGVKGVCPSAPRLGVYQSLPPPPPTLPLTVFARSLLILPLPVLGRLLSTAAVGCRQLLRRRRQEALYAHACCRRRRTAAEAADDGAARRAAVRFDRRGNVARRRRRRASEK